MPFATVSQNTSWKKKVLILVNLLLVPLVVAGGYYTVTNFTRANTCVKANEIASDSRCLYVMNGNVYQKGSKASPHKGHPCGMNVSSIIPASHMADVAMYLDPNLIGAVCAAEQPTLPPTATPTSTVAPTAFSNPSPTDTVQTMTDDQASQLGADQQNQTATTQMSETPTQGPAQSNNNQLVYVYLPKPTTQVIYVTATPIPGSSATVQTITVKGTPPGGAPWAVYSLPFGLILLGFFL